MFPLPLTKTIGGYMDQRKTITLQLPLSGATVELYEFLTHANNRDIKKYSMQALGIKMPETKDEKPDLKAIDPAVSIDIQDFTMKQLIKKITDRDGVEVVSITDFIDNLPSQDGDLLLAKADELTAGSTLSVDAKKK